MATAQNGTRKYSLKCLHSNKCSELILNKKAWYEEVEEEIVQTTKNVKNHSGSMLQSRCSNQEQMIKDGFTKTKITSFCSITWKFSYAGLTSCSCLSLACTSVLPLCHRLSISFLKAHIKKINQLSQLSTQQSILSNSHTLRTQDSLVLNRKGVKVFKCFRNFVPIR